MSFLDDHFEFQGSPQYVAFEFPEVISIEELQIKFQGGFVGKDCQLQASNGSDDFIKVIDFYPEDVNSLQVLTTMDQQNSHSKIFELRALSDRFLYSKQRMCS